MNADTKWRVELAGIGGAMGAGMGGVIDAIAIGADIVHLQTWAAVAEKLPHDVSMAMPMLLGLPIGLGLVSAIGSVVLDVFSSRGNPYDRKRGLS